MSDKLLGSASVTFPMDNLQRYYKIAKVQFSKTELDFISADLKKFSVSEFAES